MNIPFSPPDIREKEINNVIEVLKSGWITTGNKTKEFERKIAKYCETKKAICLNSATAGLELILRVLDIGEDDEVITTAYTYTASASVINHVGAKIVLADTSKDTYEIDYERLEKLINERTKAIILVDLAGIPCDYDKVFEIVNYKKKNFKAKGIIQEFLGRIAIISDAAHSFGAIYKGKTSGSIADFTSFSFHAVKNLTTAEGGAVTWNIKDNELNDILYKKFSLFSLHGQTKDALSKTQVGNWEYDIVSLGYKFNMTDIMAAIGLAQFERYDEILKYRRKNIELYDKLLNVENIKVLDHFNNTLKSSGHLYFININGKDENFRNNIIKKLAERGISTNVHYKPLPMFTAYKKLGFKIEDYKNAYNLYKNEITLPLNTILTESQIEYICNELKGALI
ncbi:DegT/DnrJ/EryC1/StrS family aminotransferase [Clostridium perfringens]|uniref:DegT/DnrJ/EryC1/StrS family aminotransferase n=1 Tax=Clostridium perfringens TaxID=1502 RepID=UPI0018E44244|nr:DegT/DnrJ/EryC1/StrS family aminotransferase [Clostridium perfringens]MBI5991361.1 DegT/DnrJ/EryC1/StrS family aminotransferase [Clostridium perfringens]MDU7548620.1 DegT/DnrJ/EryC1/StrS family aminotransferase [Clostridium perfringens]